MYVCMCECVCVCNGLSLTTIIAVSGLGHSCTITFLTWVVRGNVLIYRVDTMKISP